MSESSTKRLASLDQVQLALLVFTFAIVLGVHETLLGSLDVHVYGIGEAVPVLVTAWLPIMLAGMFYNSVRAGEESRITIEPFLVGLVSLTFVFFGLELVHSLRNETLPDFKLVLQLWWICFFLGVCISFREFEHLRQVALRSFCIAVLLGSTVIATVPAESLLQIGPIEFIRGRYRPEAPHLNSLAYATALVSAIALQRLLAGPRGELQQWAYFLTFALVGLIGARSRGAILMASVLALGLVAQALWNSRVRFVFMAGAGCLAAATALAVAGLWDPRSVLSLGRGLEFALDFPDGELQTSENLAPYALAVRLEMALTAMRIFWENPIFGVGLGRVNEAAVIGHGIHGLPFRIAGAYGALGLALVAIVALQVVCRLRLSRVTGVEVLILFVIGVTLVIRQSPPAWIALAFFLLVLSNDEKAAE